jgi:hypothetical protein
MIRMLRFPGLWRCSHRVHTHHGPKALKSKTSPVCEIDGISMARQQWSGVFRSHKDIGMCMQQGTKHRERGTTLSLNDLSLLHTLHLLISVMMYFLALLTLLLSMALATPDPAPAPQALAPSTRIVPTHLYVCTDASFAGKCSNLTLRPSVCCTSPSLSPPLQSPSSSTTTFRARLIQPFLNRYLRPELLPENLLRGPRQGDILHAIFVRRLPPSTHTLPPHIYLGKRE